MGLIELKKPRARLLRFRQEAGERDRVGRRLRRRRFGSGHRMVERALLLRLERRQHEEHGLAALARRHAPHREAAPVSHTLHGKFDRFGGVAAEDEIGVQRVGRAILDGALGGDQRLRQHLSAEHPLPTVLRRARQPAVGARRFEVEQRKEAVNVHSACFVRRKRRRQGAARRIEARHHHGRL
jgi:hypothetical protein